MFSCTEEGATQNQMGYVRVCTNGQWVYDSTATAEANKCTEEGATKTDSSSTMGFTMAMTYVCKDGQWKMDASGFQGGSSTCDVEDSTREQYGMSYICKDGKWTRDKEAEAAKNKCDKEDSTKIENGKSYICKEGQWAATGKPMPKGTSATRKVPRRTAL
jgi:hypothetical protein